MKTIPLFNKHSIILFFAALILNSLFLYFNFNNKYADCCRLLHGEIAYNMTVYNSTLSHLALYQFHEISDLVCKSRLNGGGYLNNAKDITLTKLGVPSHPPLYSMHIGYSLIMALLWKITGTFSFLDILILQILIFSALMFLWYQIGYFLFEDRYKALWGGISLLLFFPIIFLNVLVMRDIWHFYGIVFLLYGTLSYLHKNINVGILIFLFVLMSLCQFVRPNLFVTIVVTSLILLLYAFCNDRKYFRKNLIVLSCIFGTNIIFFWLPITLYNKIVYDQYLVGPGGNALMLGISVPDNPWKYPSSEAKMGKMIEERYGVDLLDIKCDKILMKLALDAIREKPFFYLKTILLRLKKCIFPSMTWDTYFLRNYKLYQDTYNSFFAHAKDIFYKMIRDWHVLVDVFTRIFYIRFFIFLGYMGMIFVLLRKKYFIFCLLFFGVIVTGFSEAIFSNFQERYIIPTYSCYSFFVGYLIVEVSILIKKKLVLGKLATLFGDVLHDK